MLAALALASPVLAALLLDRLFPFPWEALERPAAVVVADRSGEPLRFFLPADERWRFPVRLDELPPELPRAIVASEDRRFWRHPGVDLLAIARATVANLHARRVVSGASTIPMQIARMAEPGPRTLGTKLREAFRALQLEARLDKEELLELYLNLAPYGGNVEGVGAAAWFFFGKAPDQLSLGEIALLTALPRAPRGYDPTLHPEAARAARDRVLDDLLERGGFPRGEVEHARRQPVPRARRRPPFEAPHAAQFARTRSPREARIATTLDRRLQRIAEEAVRRRVAELRGLGIGNAAVVVVEHGEASDGARRSPGPARPVRALVGSAGFFEPAFDGQVNGAVARRSPGSTLKPFLYGMAIDDGRVLPDAWLLDVPTDFSGYVAENYDGRYRGRVTLREALVQSLNASAVRLLSEVGLPRFHDLLVRGGLTTLDRPPGAYGLPLVLGAGEVTLLDLTNLYATLAEGGVHRAVGLIRSPLSPALSPVPGERENLRARMENGVAARPLARRAVLPPLHRHGEGRGEGEWDRPRLFSPEAARLVTEILTDVRRPDLPEAWDLTRGVPAVAWKTGTSYGHRDAWAVGFSGRYAIGVWVGNFDGRPRQGISGSEHAGPLLFDLFRAIEPQGSRLPPDPALRLEPIELCAESRQLPGPHCPARVAATYLPGRSHLATCTVHRRALVHAATGELLAGDCAGRQPGRFVLLTVHPAELVAWWRAQGLAVPEVPAVSADCRGIPPGEKPRIVSPDPATPYRVRKEAPLEHQKIPLVARADPGARKLFWYQDGALVATGSPAERLFMAPARGAHRLVVTDDLGRTDGVTYRVE